MLLMVASQKGESATPRSPRELSARAFCSPDSITLVQHPNADAVQIQFGPWRSFLLGLSDVTLRYSEVDDGSIVQVDPLSCR